MQISNITWRGEEIEDAEFLREIPAELAAILTQTNGFILHHGALHVRGACREPQWHSLQHAWRSTQAFHYSYMSLLADDIPFAQDQFGDQILLRGGKVIKLLAESDDIQPLSENIKAFFEEVEHDIETFLNVSLEKKLDPGKLWLASPPFVLQESATGAHLKPVDTMQVIRLHANIARQVREVSGGQRVVIKINPDL